MRKQAYRERATPVFETFGPKNDREFEGLLAERKGLPSLMLWASAIGQTRGNTGGSTPLFGSLPLAEALVSEPVVSRHAEIVDLRLAHNLQEKVPACPKSGIENTR